MSIQNALADLSSLLGQRLSRSKSDLDLHGRSESYFTPCPPDAVAYPKSTQEVSQIMQICARHNCPVTAWGTGTSLEGQSQAIHGGLVVDFSQMKQILQINQADMDVVVQPGLTREELNEELRATGLFFPVDPGANAALGGMASTRASGTTTVRYGTMGDNVCALEVVLADGRIMRTGTRARKTAAGYDLTGLFVGAEGTLGLITEMTLRLQGQPESISAAVCAFDHIGDAVDAVIDTIQMGIPIARIEFLDADVISAVNAYAGTAMTARPHLFVEFHGSETGVREQVETFGEIARDHDGRDFEWASRAEDRNALWTARHNAYYAILAGRPGSRAIVTDICVPISHLTQAVQETREDIQKSGLPGPILGHVGDGNFHAILLIDPNSTEELQLAKSLSNRMVERALALGGTATGEHGIGRGKLSYMQAEHGEGWQVMGALKAALDPENLLNPGKLVPPTNRN